MDETENAGRGMTSAAAFVEGGIQEACDDACCICLEEFCDSDPSTVTNCKHEFHLQCVLEWCQRSSNCPMCWQDISLKDPSSQELLEAVEQERKLRSIPARDTNTMIFHHPALGNFQLQHLPAGMDNAGLEDRILQHLAAAMGRTHRIVRREGPRNRPTSHGHELLVCPADPNGTSTISGGQETELTGARRNAPLAPPAPGNNQAPQQTLSSAQNNQMSESSSGSSVTPTTRPSVSNDNRNYACPSTPNQDRAGPSEQSFSDTWRSRLSSMSMKYKESISRSTKEWKEKLLSRSSSMADIGSEVRREVNAGLSTVSRMMEHLETRNDNRADRVTSNAVNSSVNEQWNNNRDTPDDSRLNDCESASNMARST